MAKSPKQKQKLLYIAKYLMEQTDETHTVTMPQILAYLEKNDIYAERKSIYDDIASLNDFGYDILREPGPKGGYYLASREFELAEIKLLVDLVQSSKFITPKKSRELIKKLSAQVSQNNAHALIREIVVTDRGKTRNESIYYSVDVIYEAMSHNSQIRFQYFEWDIDKKRKLRKDGTFYEISPWLLTWDDENYYLVGFDSEASIMKYFRVDKMIRLGLFNKPRLGYSEFQKMDIDSFSRKTFGMFAGEEKTIRMRCDNSMTSILVDRFGQNVSLRPIDDEHIMARTNIAVSTQFFGWLAGMGNRIQIEAPIEVAEEYQNYLASILAAYKTQTTLEDDKDARQQN